MAIGYWGMMMTCLFGCDCLVLKPDEIRSGVLAVQTCPLGDHWANLSITTWFNQEWWQSYWQQWPGRITDREYCQLQFAVRLRELEEHTKWVTEGDWCLYWRPQSAYHQIYRVEDGYVEAIYGVFSVCLCCPLLVLYTMVAAEWEGKSLTTRTVQTTTLAYHLTTPPTHTHAYIQRRTVHRQHTSRLFLCSKFSLAVFDHSSALCVTATFVVGCQGVSEQVLSVPWRCRWPPVSCAHVDVVANDGKYHSRRFGSFVSSVGVMESGPVESVCIVADPLALSYWRR